MVSQNPNSPSPPSKPDGNRKPERNQLRFGASTSTSPTVFFTSLHKLSPQARRGRAQPSAELIMSGEDRSWMDNRWNSQGKISDEFRRGVNFFVEFARLHPECLRDGKIRCPCSDCRNKKVQAGEFIKMHLMKVGFVENYKRWIVHGEPAIVGGSVPNCVSVAINSTSELEEMTVNEEQYVGMSDMARNPEKERNDATVKFQMMDCANEKLYPGADHTVLEAVVELLKIKADSNMSQHTFDRIASLFKRVLPKENKMVANFYDAKKLVEHIGLDYEKIDCCRNQCMLFYKENDGLQSCSVCGLHRYKSPRRGSGGGRGVGRSGSRGGRRGGAGRSGGEI